MDTWMSSVDGSIVKWGWGHRSNANMIQVGVYSRFKGQIISQIQSVQPGRFGETQWAEEWRFITVTGCGGEGFQNSCLLMTVSYLYKNLYINAYFVWQ